MFLPERSFVLTRSLDLYYPASKVKLRGVTGAQPTNKQRTMPKARPELRKIDYT
jgi:hypothetical protein